MPVPLAPYPSPPVPLTTPANGIFSQFLWIQLFIPLLNPYFINFISSLNKKKMDYRN